MIVYHLSAVDLGDSPVLSPRLPRDRMPFENSSVRRVCVSDSISGCLLALSGCYYNRGLWWAYRLDADEGEISEPIGVPDAGQTGEKWILEPQRFRRA